MDFDEWNGMKHFDESHFDNVKSVEDGLRIAFNDGFAEGRKSLEKELEDMEVHLKAVKDMLNEALALI